MTVIDWSRIVGRVLFSVGLILLLGIISFYIYGLYSYSRLDKLNALADPSSYTKASEGDRHDISDGSRDPISGYISIYPGYHVHPKYWHQPLWAGSDSPTYRLQEFAGVLEGFDVSLPVKPLPQSDTSQAVSIRIPIIGIDSAVYDLAILHLGNSKSYETPKQVVGHIPGTAGPGQVGNGWFFGHLESPIKGEGNVFSKLPRIAQHLRDGDPVYIILGNEHGEYLYQVTNSRVVHQDKLELYDTDTPTITLVTCSNRPLYNYRQLVTAELMGVKYWQPSGRNLGSDLKQVSIFKRNLFSLVKEESQIRLPLTSLGLPTKLLLT